MYISYVYIILHNDLSNFAMQQGQSLQTYYLTQKMNQGIMAEHYLKTLQQMFKQGDC